MDLFLMDLLLKGMVPVKAKVLDVGCGEGRNGIFFIRNGYEYHGWDTDQSKIKLIEYLSKSIKGTNARFEVQDLLSVISEEQFDFIICSRVLHFADSRESFINMWKKLTSFLNPEGLIYFTMDSVVDNSVGKPIRNGQYEFPNSKIRFALTTELYDDIKKGFEEVEPLRTLVHHNERAQSFIVLKKKD
ncbi:class I SAM-dependent methyltransferase [Ekhidna sp.]|uniref:class I SAM-dependent methyltransferase n=1 Tax=Ekhidna sp. TaxID=2608089 RepID=UPI003B50DDCD